LPPASPKADAPPQERLLHEKPPGGNNEQLVGGLHATETDELFFFILRYQSHVPVNLKPVQVLAEWLRV